MPPCPAGIMHRLLACQPGPRGDLDRVLILLPLPVLLGLAGCAPPDVDRLLVIDRLEDGSYDTVPRQVPELDDPRRLSGTLGTGWRGGLLGISTYDRGARLDITWRADGDTGIPLYSDGLILWSYYAHLGATRADLSALGYDIEPIFPIDVAWNPVSVLDFQAVENAAYSPGAHVFVIFPDLLSEGVPLAANAGVVRHEFAHAWFSLITGELGQTPPWQQGSTETTLRVSALNEGFADMIATLSLDEPRFIQDSLAMPSRDVTGDWRATTGKYPPSQPDVLDTLAYDPYPLGTVFASLAWDIREATDPETALELVIASTEQWAAEGDWGDIDRFAELLVEAAQSEAPDAACAAFEARFPEHEEPPSCAAR